MTPLSPTRRAAEEFARVVDGSQVDVADRYADLTACVDVLRAQEIPAPRAEFTADLRAQLMAAADTLLVPAETRLAPVVPLQKAGRRRQRHLAGLAAAVVLVGGTAGVAAAAENALPGDPLYPLKRGIESAQVSLSGSDAARGRDLIAQAGTRLAEVRGLVDNGASSSQIDHTLAAYEQSASDGADLLFVSFQRDGDVEDLSGLRGSFSDQAGQLKGLQGQVPSDSLPALRQAAATLADLDQQARVLCANCGPGGSAAFAGTTSAPSLDTLLIQPAAAASADALASEAAELAKKAGQVASQTPSTPVTGGSSTGSTGGSAGVPSLPTSGGSVTTTVNGVTKTVTDGVSGLLDEVDSATGGATSPVTDPVTDTLNNTVDGATDTINGLLP